MKVLKSSYLLYAIVEVLIGIFFAFEELRYLLKFIYPSKATVEIVVALRELLT